MTIDAVFSEGSSKTFTKSLSQYDRGTSLRFIGVSLPSQFEVHFSNLKENGVATVVTGKNYVVTIPDAYFVSGDYIYAWLYVYGTKTVNTYTLNNEILYAIPSSETVPDTRKSNSILEVTIPINRRPAPLILPESDASVDLSDGSLNYGFDSESESLIIGQD